MNLHSVDLEMALQSFVLHNVIWLLGSRVVDASDLVVNSEWVFAMVVVDSVNTVDSVTVSDVLESGTVDVVWVLGTNWVVLLEEYRVNAVVSEVVHVCSF